MAVTVVVVQRCSGDVVDGAEQERHNMVVNCKAKFNN